MNETNPDNQHKEFDEAEWRRQVSLAKDGDELRALLHELPDWGKGFSSMSVEDQKSYFMEQLRQTMNSD